MVNEDLDIEEFREIQSLILEILYNHWVKEFVPYLDTFYKFFKSKYNKPLNKTIFDIAFNSLIEQKLIEVVEKTETTTKDGKKTKRTFIRITANGTTRVLERKLKEKTDKIVIDAEKSVDDLEERINNKIKETRTYLDEIQVETGNIKGDIERIDEDFKKEQNRFYAKLIEIFGIFVAIFSFIIVGFNQYCCMISKDCSVTGNIAYIVTIFTLLVLILLILLWAVGRVVKSINKSDDETNQTTTPNDEPTSKAFGNWFLFTIMCAIVIFEFFLISVIFRIPSNIFNIGLQALFILSISLIISYSTGHDKGKKILWNASSKSMILITTALLILLFILEYLALESLGAF